MFVLYWIICSIVCESLPISSSGHVLLLKKICKLSDTVSQMPGSADFLIQGPTVLILALFFYPRWQAYIKSPVRLLTVIKKLFFLGAVTELITIIFYLLFKFTQFSLPLAVGFFVSSCVLFSLYYCPVGGHRSFDFWSAIVLGLVQGAALLPGISRFGLTFVAAQWLGFSGKKSMEISFLIEWPLCFASWLLGIASLKTDSYTIELLHLNTWFIMVIASGVAYGLLWLVADMVHKRRIAHFSWYLLFISLVSGFVV